MRSAHKRPWPRWTEIILDLGLIVVISIVATAVLAAYLSFRSAPRPAQAVAPPPPGVVVESEPPSALWDPERAERLLLQPILRGKR